MTPPELRFRELLAHAWKHSPLYRRIYAQSGIRERDLPHVPLHDLPPVSKSDVMEHFDEAVTDLRLRSEQLKVWLQQDSNPLSLYLDEYIVVHSSGGSRISSIVPCTPRTWRQMTTIAAPDILPVDPDIRVPLRSAFYFSADGHFGGSTNTSFASHAGHEVLQVNVRDPVEEVWAKLNAFKPEHLSTYASTLPWLTAWTLEGRLRIRPRSVLVSGDNLTPQVRSLVREAWGAEVYDLYAAVESLYIAVRKPGRSEFKVFGDLNVLEVVDAYHRMVRPGESGRVLLTNLINRTLPMIRFDLCDEAILGRASFGAETLGNIEGKTTVRLPVRLADGHLSTLPLRDLHRIHVPGCTRLQFVSHSPDEIEIRYESQENLESQVEAAFRTLLAARSASVRSVRACRVPHILNDAQTAKFLEVVTPDRSALSLIHLSAAATDAPSATRAETADIPDSGFGLPESPESIFERFEEIVAKYPGRVAVTDDKRCLTYVECREAAHRIARELLARDFKPERPVAVLSAHRMEMIPPLLAIPGAGGFYLSLDSNMPLERLKTILSETQPEYILAGAGEEELAEAAAGIHTQVLRLDDLIARQTPETPLPRVSPEAPACLLYTSGSTGAPKGVVLSHRTVMSRVRHYTRDFGLRPVDRLSLLQSFSVSAGVRDIFGALLNGAALAIYDIRSQGVQPLPGWINRQGISVLYAVPTAWRLLMAILSDETFPTVRVVRLGGETVEPRDLDGFKLRFPQGCRFVNGYAATETDTVCQYFMDHRTGVVARRIPVGWPVAGVAVQIRDDTGSQVANTVGEIAVAGNTLASGYWDPQRRTIIPLRTHALATGDLGYQLPDGRIFLTGRRDFIVKVRGYRIDLSEIEHALSRIPGVKEAVAVLSRTPGADAGIAAYYVTADGNPMSPEILHRAAAAVLPSLTVPIVFMPISVLPRLAGGKVNRSILSNHVAYPREPVGEDIVYQSPTETTLAQIWASVLGIERIPRGADFVALGGDSITALRVINRIRCDFNVDVSVREFFDHCTVAGLARIVDEYRSRPSK